jgi:deazaflavin-dependent oxidoreductase (nitroreductase family)
MKVLSGMTGLIFLIVLAALLLAWGIVSNLHHAAGMRRRDPCVIDRTRKANKQGRNRLITTIGRAGKRNSPFALLHHTGRKSGKDYVTPVRLVRLNSTFIIPMTYGERADWYKNLLACGTMEITWQGQTHKVGNPERLEIDSAMRAFPWISRMLFRLEGLPGFLQVTPLSQVKHP